MIAHLAASGTAVSWAVTALYRSNYGVAHTAASAWYESTREPDGDRDEPQYVVKLSGSDADGWTVERDDLWMDEAHRRKQSHDALAWLVQTHTAPMPLSAALGEAITEALRARLVDFGYLVPMDEWKRRYPARALMNRRFAEFGEADQAARAAGVELAFEPRWAGFMPMPEDHHIAFSTGFVDAAGHLVEHDMGGSTPVVVTRGGPDDLWTRFDDPALPAFAAKRDAEAAMRLLNSGWEPADVAVLLGGEPVD